MHCPHSREGVAWVCVCVCACMNQFMAMCKCPWAFTRSYLSCSCVRVCANCKSMRLLISIRDFALLWFRGMGGKGLEVADQDRQKSPRIPSYHQCQLSLSLALMFLSTTLTSHTPWNHFHNEFIYLFIHLLNYFPLCACFHATCLILEQLGGVVGPE